MYFRFFVKVRSNPSLAKRLETSTRYITNILETEGIRPIPFTKVHNKPSYYVYHRVDIGNLNLEKLVEARRGITLHSQVLDIEGAAEFLSTKPEIISEIVANGIPVATPNEATIAGGELLQRETSSPSEKQDRCLRRPGFNPGCGSDVCNVCQQI